MLISIVEGGIDELVLLREVLQGSMVRRVEVDEILDRIFTEVVLVRSSWSIQVQQFVLYFQQVWEAFEDAAEFVPVVCKQLPVEDSLLHIADCRCDPAHQTELENDQPQSEQVRTDERQLPRRRSVGRQSNTVDDEVEVVRREVERAFVGDVELLRAEQLAVPVDEVVQDFEGWQG